MPVRAALRAAARDCAEERPPLEPVEPGPDHAAACFNPVPVGDAETRPSRESAVATNGAPDDALVGLEDSRSGSRSRAASARPPRRGRARRRRRHARRSGAARRSASSASPAAASRPSAGRSCGSTSRPAAGRVRRPGRSRARRDALRPLRRRMQMVFQDPYASLEPAPSIGRIVGEPLRAHGLAARRASGRPRPRAARDRRPAAGRATRYPHEFSGGQRQRIGVARALAVEPGPDHRGRAGLGPRRLDPGADPQPARVDSRRSSSLTYLFIAHDLAVVRHISDRIAVMYLGAIVEVAGADDLYERPLHPYTISLLSAVPIPDPVIERQRKAILLAGDLPSPADPPSGCRFHTRCPYVQPTRCRDEVPPSAHSARPATRPRATGPRTSRRAGSSRRSWIRRARAPRRPRRNPT